MIHCLYKESEDFYTFDNEPIAIWMMDKIQIRSEERWKVIVYFRNGDIKELQINKVDGQTTLSLVKYLVDVDRNEVKFNGKI